MAHMIPATPKEFDERSHEGDVFNALKKLPDDYYVFHSVSTVGVTDDNVFYERELDFVVASPKKGILAIEVKAGNNIHFVGRTWRYSSGRVMSPVSLFVTVLRMVFTDKSSAKSEVTCSILDLFFS